MSEEMLKWLVSTGVGGVIGGVALWIIDRRAKAIEARIEGMTDEIGKLPDWLAGIHSRLGSLGADSSDPPPRESHPRGRKYARIRTSPVGWKIPQPDEDKEDP